MSASGDSLAYRLRESDGDPAGALVLLHGRGADESDLFPLLDMLDPERRLLGVTPRGPLSFPPGGAHWYRLARVGSPDRSTFLETYERLKKWFDDFVLSNGFTHERVVVGGFSQGAAMSYALSLGAGRPRPALLATFSGFIPTVDGFELDLEGLEGYPVAIGHGTYDSMIEVDWGRKAKETLEEAGADVRYQESPMPHTIDPAWVEEVAGFVSEVLRLESSE
ncbi:MAG: phospholipase [Actinobacteria bacterium]|nr:phospholipase [Actinomycetota bacterium]